MLSAQGQFEIGMLEGALHAFDLGPGHSAGSSTNGGMGAASSGARNVPPSTLANRIVPKRPKSLTRKR